MVRTSWGGAVVVGCFGALQLGACGTSPGKGAGTDERLDNVQLALQPVSGLTLTSLRYAVTRGSSPANLVAEGNLPTPGIGRTVSFGVSLPVGSGYTLNLSAESAEPDDGITCTGNFGPFEVKPNESTRASLALTCVDNSSGQTFGGLGVESQGCPRLVIDHFTASPVFAYVGEPIAVSARAHDLDNPSAPISYSWSGDFPAFLTSSQGASASFTCVVGSGAGIVIRVTASNGECSKTLETTVDCSYYESCGNGVVEPEWGENCDPFLDPTCPVDCTRICGDGIVESGEECDPVPSDPAVCHPPGTTNACHFRTECGDGVVAPPEACDSNFGSNGQPLPLAYYCSADCSAVLPYGFCGDGVTSGAEECDAGTNPVAPFPVTSRLCSAACESISTQPCVDCEQAGDCFASSDNCLGPQSSFTLSQQQLCTDVMQCVQDSDCLNGTGSLGQCYCGTLSTAACGAAPFDLTAPGAPNGPCAALIQQGSPGLSSNTAILGGLTNKSRPAGAAGQRLNCQKADPACAAVCGVQ
jgi:hypothetical protein